MGEAGAVPGTTEAQGERAEGHLRILARLQGSCGPETQRRGRRAGRDEPRRARVDGRRQAEADVRGAESAGHRWRTRKEAASAITVWREKGSYLRCAVLELAYR